MTAPCACPCADELATLRACVAGLELTLLEVRSLLRLQSGAPARSAPADPVPTQEQAYARVLDALPALLAGLVPAGGRVLVVSRGDDRLLEVPGRTGGHFPQAPGGAYAGHHPHDSDDAVARLEALRTAGWTHLAFPDTALWWLDHYAGLRGHLERTAALLHRGGPGAVYRLPDPHPDADLEHAA